MYAILLVSLLSQGQFDTTEPASPEEAARQKKFLEVDKPKLEARQASILAGEKLTGETRAQREARIIELDAVEAAREAKATARRKANEERQKNIRQFGKPTKSPTTKEKVKAMLEARKAKSQKKPASP